MEESLRGYTGSARRRELRSIGRRSSQWSSLTYYQGGGALEGFNTGDFVGLLFMSIVFVAIATWLFQRRNIRIAGEGGWRLPLLKRRARAA